MTILLLGGTADGRHFARRVYDEGLLANASDMQYSVAGLVRKPDLDCQVISGGFSSHGGIEEYLAKHSIQLILDMTHPYAKDMSQKARSAATSSGLPYWRFERPAWSPREGDQWKTFTCWSDLVDGVGGFQSVLLTVGQLDQSQFDQFAKKIDGQIIYRTAAASRIQLSENAIWLKAIGPYEEDSELALFEKYKVDLLVSKNSGGASTFAKIEAARRLNIPVYMLDRPASVLADQCFEDEDSLFRALQHWCLVNKVKQDKPNVV